MKGTKMYEVEPLNDIVKRFREADRSVRDAVAEHRRQLIERQRDEDSAILEAAKRPGAHSQVVETAKSIEDHRSNGNYTAFG